jgi:hypothetical protein
MAGMALPTGTKVLRVGLRANALDYELHPELDYDMMAARIAAAEKELQEAGVAGVNLLIGRDPDEAEAMVRETMAAHSFGLALIGGGVRTRPENTLLFERLLNTMTELAPGIRFCFNTSPEDALDAIRRWSPAS